MIASPWPLDYRSLRIRNPEALATSLKTRGFIDTQPEYGELHLLHHAADEIRARIFRSGVVIMYGTTWDTLRPAIAAIVEGGEQ